MAIKKDNTMNLILASSRSGSGNNKAVCRSATRRFRSIAGKTALVFGLLIVSSGVSAQTIQHALPPTDAAVASGAPTPDTIPSPRQVRQAAVRGLQFVEQKAVAWIKTKKCVACHHGPFLLWAHDEAKKAGVAVDQEKLSEWTQWALKNASPQRMDKACKDDLDAHHQLRLSRSPSLLDQKTEEAFQAISKHLLGRQQPDGSWIPGNRFRTQQRRPQHESKEVTTMWSVLALGTVEKNAAERTESRQKALAWLKGTQPGKSNESLVLHLLIQHEFGEADRKQELLTELRGHQNEDGGWSWLHGEASDALATGLSMYALSIVNPDDPQPTADSAIGRASRFLVNTQQPDGSWVVPTTLAKSKRPACGVPAYWGTAWATIGLVRTLRKPIAGRKANTSAEGTPPLGKAPFDAKQAKRIQRQWAKYVGGSVVETNSIGMKMTLIPPGEFLMGSARDELDEALAEAKNRWKKRDWFTLWAGWVKSETPQHRVRITRPFYLGATEVTVGQFRHFVEAAGYKTAIARAPNPKPRRAEFPKLWMRGKFVDPPSENCPASYISWTDAVAFCRWLSEKEGARYRLPTEAEWEYACRAGTQTKWFFGDDIKLFPQYMQFAADPGKGPMFVVGQKKPNPFGLFDMHGGVYEWCSDWFAGDYYQASPVNDPQGPEAANPTYWPEQLPLLDPGLDREQKSRAARGGAFNFTDALRLRSAHRIGLGTTGGHWHLGFRVVLEAPGAP